MDHPGDRMMNSTARSSSSRSNPSRTEDSATSPRLFFKGIHLPAVSFPESEHTEDDVEKSLPHHRRQLFQQAVRDLFEPFGRVVEVFVPSRTKSKISYAFVTMETCEQAQRVLDQFKTTTTATPLHAQRLFDDIRPADALPVKCSTTTDDPRSVLLPVEPSVGILQPSKMKQKQRLEREMTLVKVEKLMAMAKSANLVLQCDKSHVERLMEYLVESEKDVTVLGSTNYKIVSLLFCQCHYSPLAVLQWLESIWYIQTNIHRIFVLSTTTTSTTTTNKNINTSNVVPFQNNHSTTTTPAVAATATASTTTVPFLLQSRQVPAASTWVDLLWPPPTQVSSHDENSNRPSHCHRRRRIRLNTYPPKLQSELLLAMENYFSADSTSQSRVASGLAKEQVGLTFTPSKDAATHVWSVLELIPPNPTLEQDGLYLVGLYETIPLSSNPPVRIGDMPRTTRPTTISSHDNPNEVSESCCRAYWKLQEALERYQERTGRVPLPLWNRTFTTTPVLEKSRTTTTSTSRSNMITLQQHHSAIDVGASPGGWTQFLVQQCQCRTVYSIDPGRMDAKVLALNDNAGDDDNDNDDNKNDRSSSTQRQRNIVQHVPLTFQKGLPLIAKQRRSGEQELLQEGIENDNDNEDVDKAGTRTTVAVDWYVSDMCVKNLGGQIDALLMAVKLGLVARHKTFVILTIKCTRGHSKATYDSLVKEQVRRILGNIPFVSSNITTTSGDCEMGKNTKDATAGAAAASFETLHLFANRKSERTIMGVWQ